MTEQAGIQDLDGGTGAPGVAPPRGEEAGGRVRRARLASVSVLALVLALLGRGAASAYHAFNDSFVAPITLSPDSDAVMQDRLALGRLLSEREGLAARVVEDAGAAESLRASLELLKGLEESSARSLGWSREKVTNEFSRGATDRALLRSQHGELEGTVERQRAYVVELERSLAAGLVRRSDLERERSFLDQAQVSLLQNEREQAAALAREQENAAARRALGSGSGSRPILSTPEMQAQQELSTRIRIDMLRARSDLSGREARLRADREQLARVDELVAQLRERPTLQAVADSQHLAFAPYKEIDGVRAGAVIFRCPFWGLFGCGRVGTVRRLLPGEVSSHDRWGTEARGQYVLLDLTDPSAAQAPALRIRGSQLDAPGKAAPAARADATR